MGWLHDLFSGLWHSAALLPAQTLLAIGTEPGNRIAQFLLALVALVVALAGAAIALNTYTSSARDAANAHMHGLFRDYLRARLDVSMATPPKRSALPYESVSDQLTALKLYALEEMYSWVQREEKYNRDWLIWTPYRGSKARRDRSDFLYSWRKTILVHASQEGASVLKSFQDYASCYSVAFLRFVADDWCNQELENLVERHETALHERKRRPSGRLERIAQSRLSDMGASREPA